MVKRELFTVSVKFGLVDLSWMSSDHSRLQCCDPQSLQPNTAQSANRVQITHTNTTDIDQHRHRHQHRHQHMR